MSHIGQLIRGHGARRRGLAVALAAALAGGTAYVALGATPAGAAESVGHGGYRATIVRTAYGVPHITAPDYGSLGFGYGYAFATDDLCTMADDYVTVEGRRSRYFGPDGTDTESSSHPITNIDSDVYWQAAVSSGAVTRLLAPTTGPGAVLPQVRRLVAGYVAGYDDYLASVGGSRGVPDPTCRGQAWVKPITVLDAYLRIYQLADVEGVPGDPGSWTETRPPAGTATGPGVDAGGLAAAFAPALPGAPGSNALAIGSQGTRDHGAGILLGNPHLPWSGAERVYEVQMTIPGQLNVEGGALYATPIVEIGFNSSVAWSHTDSPSIPLTLYQVTLVPGHPTEYVVDGRAVPMTARTATVLERSAGGLVPVTRTLYATRWGPVVNELHGIPLPWTAGSAYVLADASAANLRFVNESLGTAQATSAAGVLAVQRRYEGGPWWDTVAADSAGHTLYSDIGSFPNVTDALAERCDTALGAQLFAQAGLPVLDGSRSGCAWGTDADSAAPGIFGTHEEPVLARSDYVENSNWSYWLANASAPLTGFPRILGMTGIPASLRTRGALTMITRRIAGTDGLGPAGFTLRDVQNLQYADVEFGAALVKPQLVSLCESLPGGLAPTSAGGTVAAGDACRVLAAWNGREDPGSRGALLFRDFWQRALALPEGPWAVPFNPADPVNTPSGLNVGDRSVAEAFGDALADFTAAKVPYGEPLGARQYVVRGGVRIPMPGGPGDPEGEFNAFYPSGDPVTEPGTDPTIGSSYILAVTWAGHGAGTVPVARTVLTYSLSDNPDSPHYADQTELFSRRGWADAPYTSADVRAQAVSTTTVSGP